MSFCVIGRGRLISFSGLSTMGDGTNIMPNDEKNLDKMLSGRGRLLDSALLARRVKSDCDSNQESLPWWAGVRLPWTLGVNN